MSPKLSGSAFCTFLLLTIPVMAGEFKLPSPRAEQPREILAELRGVNEAEMLALEASNKKAVVYDSNLNIKKEIVLNINQNSQNFSLRSSTKGIEGLVPNSDLRGPWDFKRTGHKTGVLKLQTGVKSETYNIRAKYGELGRVKPLRALDDRVYVLREEILPSPTFDIRSFVTEFFQGEEREVEVPLTPTIISGGSYVYVGKEGRVYYFSEKDGFLGVSSAEIGEMQNLKPEKFEHKSEISDFDFMGEVRKSSPSISLRSTNIDWRRIKANYTAILNTEWLLSESNYQSTRLQSICDIPESPWRRPYRLNGKQDQAIVSIPYKWGGYMRISRFLEMIESGALAGDICTCRSEEHDYCIVDNAAGLDCSGFLSQVWEIEYHTTSYLKNVSRVIHSSDIEPGDALNKPGEHVRLFVGYADADQKLYKIVESSISCGGVCERVLTPSEMRGYSVIRREGFK